MLNRIHDLWRNIVDPDADHQAIEHGVDVVQLAACACLAEVLIADGDVEEIERERMIELLQIRFGLSREETEELIARTSTAMAEGAPLYRMTASVRDYFSRDERIELLEMLWDIAIEDEATCPHEKGVVEHVAERIGLTAHESERVRLRMEQRRRLLRAPDLPDHIR